MDAVVVIVAVVVLVAVPIVLWRLRHGRLARGMGEAGRYHNAVLGLGGGTGDTVVDADAGTSAPPAGSTGHGARRAGPGPRRPPAGR